MYIIPAILLYLVVGVRSQGDMTQCASACVANTFGTNCSPSEWSCLCQSQTYLERASDCIKSSCSSADYSASTSAVKQLCAIFNASLTFGPYATASTQTDGTVSALTPTSISTTSSGRNTSAVVFSTLVTGGSGMMNVTTASTGHTDSITSTSTPTSISTANTSPSMSTNGGFRNMAGLNFYLAELFAAAAFFV